MGFNTCRCGCGTEIEPKRWHKYTGVPEYVIGHNARGASPDRPNRKRYNPSPGEIPSGLCECGCGGTTNIWTKTTRRDRRYFTGHPVPFIRGHANRKTGSESHKWTGGRFLHKSTGYVRLYAPDHPEADSKGYVAEHRFLMEQHLGRPLLRTEHVHHINGVKHDNRMENLVVLTVSEHRAIHAPDRIYSPEARQRMSEAGKKGAAARWGKND